VAFEDDETEGKDRPVLVLSGGGTVSVLKITSQDKGHLRGYLALPRNRVCGVLAKDSWLELKPVPVPADAFRSYRGTAPSWLRNELRGRELMPAGAGPGAGLARGDPVPLIQSHFSGCPQVCATLFRDTACDGFP
jgi:hypothetical protein